MLQEPPTSRDSTPTLSKLFRGLHRTLETQLGIARDSVDHAATLGALSEDKWITVLREHLPKRYKVSRAFVIDSQGGCSRQIDTVIHDRQYSPFVLNLGGALFVPAESVYAVLEVKQNLNAEQIADAVLKVASVRCLHRTSLPVPTIDGLRPAKEPHHIVGGIVALESDWTPPFGAAFTDAIALSDLSGRLDMGCAVRDGVFQAKYPEGQVPELIAEESDAALALFLLRLIARLQAMATVPQLDVAAYADSITRTRVI